MNEQPEPSPTESLPQPIGERTTVHTESRHGRCCRRHRARCAGGATDDGPATTATGSGVPESRDPSFDSQALGFLFGGDLGEAVEDIRRARRVFPRRCRPRRPRRSARTKRST